MLSNIIDQASNHEALLEAAYLEGFEVSPAAAQAALDNKRADHRTRQQPLQGTTRLTGHSSSSSQQPEQWLQPLQGTTRLTGHGSSSSHHHPQLELSHKVASQSHPTACSRLAFSIIVACCLLLPRKYLGFTYVCLSWCFSKLSLVSKLAFLCGLALRSAVV